MWLLDATYTSLRPEIVIEEVLSSIWGSYETCEVFLSQMLNDNLCLAKLSWLPNQLEITSILWPRYFIDPHRNTSGFHGGSDTDMQDRNAYLQNIWFPPF